MPDDLRQLEAERETIRGGPSLILPSCGRDHNLEAQITSKMHELIACMCVVNFRQEGDRRGIIEQIESLTLGREQAPE